MSSPPTGILFYDGRARPLSTTGQVQAGAYYQFYLTQTTTLANVYADGGLTSPLSQTPGSGQTTAAADGRFIPIYLSPATTYRYQLYSSTNVLLEDVDPWVVPSTPSGTLTAPITVNASASPVPVSLEFNFNGNGTANDIDFAGVNNGPNELFLRANSTGTSAIANLGVSDANSFGVITSGTGQNFTSNVIGGAANGRSGAVYTNYNAPLYLGANTRAILKLDGTGELEFVQPPSAVATSISAVLNGNGTGNDIDIQGPFNGANVVALRATSSGTNARGNIVATDSAGHGLVLTGTGSSYTGTILTGAGSGVAAGISTNAAIPLYLGSNSNATIKIDSTGFTAFIAPPSQVTNSIIMNLNGNGTGNDVDITGPLNGANVVAFRATSGGTSARANIVATDNVGHGLVLTGTGSGYTGTILTGASSGVAAGISTNAAIPLYLGSNSNATLKIDSTGVLTMIAPTSAVATSVEINVNGNGTGNDFDIAGPFNGPNELFMRATSSGTGARAVVAAADNNSLGLLMAAAGTGFTGSLATGGPSGRGAMLTMNYNAPLSIGINSNANMIFGSTAVAVGTDISARGVYLARFKSGDTTTTNSAALTNDPDLQIAIGIGTFYYRVCMIVTAGAGGATPGLRFGINYSGTCTNGTEFFTGFNGASTSGTGAAGTNISGISAYNGNAATSGLFLFEGTITVTTAGTFAFAWGQSVSSGTATTMKAGSTMQITQVN